MRAERLPDQCRQHRARSLVAALLLASVLGACTKSAPPAADAPAPASPASAGPAAGGAADQDQAALIAAALAKPDLEDPCQMLQPAEVEALLGPLDVPPFRVDPNKGPMMHGDVCRYRAKDLHELEVSVVWTGAERLFGSLDVPGQVAEQSAAADPARRAPAGGTLLHKETAGANGAGVPQLRPDAIAKGLVHGVPIAGDWDEVKVIGCCIMNAILGDAAVVIDYTGTRLTDKQAVSLVNQALHRLPAPLSAIDGRRQVPPERDRIARQAKPPQACALVPRAAAEAILGQPLSAEPSGDAENCTFHYRVTHPVDGSVSEEMVELQASFSGGYRSYREQAYAEASTNKAFGLAGAGSGSVAGAAQSLENIGKAMEGSKEANPFDALGKAIKEEARKASGQKTATPEDTAKDAKPAAAPVGPWEDAMFSFPSFYAVKKDIMIRVKAGLTSGTASKFAAKAMERL